MRAIHGHHVVRDEQVRIEKAKFAEYAERTEDAGDHAGALADVGETDIHIVPMSESIFGPGNSP